MSRKAVPGEGLPEELERAAELIARDVHEAWMEEKTAQGWAYGQELDREHRTHPSIAPYDSLSRQEKELDIQTARQVIESLLRLGFRITRD